MLLINLYVLLSGNKLGFSLLKSLILIPLFDAIFFHIGVKNIKRQKEKKQQQENRFSWIIQIRYSAYISTDILTFTQCHSAVQKCIELISRAKKPVILVGSQATLPPVSVEDLRKALEVV